jgi:AcrR family transcriptional regulator
MKRINTRNRSTPSKRQLIIETALSCFAELGLDRAGMEDIRSRSGASTGSIYHHFGSKEQLAAEVYLEGIRRYQEEFLSAIEAETDARAGIRAVVRAHLEWVRDHPDWARFLFQQRRAEFMTATEGEFSRINADFFGRASLWFARHIKAGALRRLPADLYVALILGPCQEYTRMYLSGHARTGPEEIAGELAEAIWRAVGRLAE